MSNALRTARRHLTSAVKQQQVTKDSARPMVNGFRNSTIRAARRIAAAKAAKAQQKEV